MALTVNEIVSCSLSGLSRRVYMRGKALELLSLTVSALENDAKHRPESGLRLSRSDLAKLAEVKDLLANNLEKTWTLAELARHVGLNRTKLALGFKWQYGISIQACHRDLRLARAKELLVQGDLPITEIALSSGYAELSSFTRAFSQKFGVVPRRCRNSA
jgi:transcriptional regulator GlxA family with amidase domain